MTLDRDTNKCCDMETSKYLDKHQTSTNARAYTSTMSTSFYRCLRCSPSATSTLSSLYPNTAATQFPCSPHNAALFLHIV